MTPAEAVPREDGLAIVAETAYAPSAWKGKRIPLTRSLRSPMGLPGRVAMVNV